MSTNPFLEYVSYAVWIVFFLISLFFAVQTYRTKIKWGSARRMGATTTIFAWITFIYGLVLFEGVVYALLSFFLGFPLWMDILLFLVIAGLLVTVYFMLRSREKFKPAMFRAAFLIPFIGIGIHGLPAVGKLISGKFSKLPAEPAMVSPVHLNPMDPSRAFKQSNAVRDHSPRQVHIKGSGYRVEFQNPHSKGKFGDWLTAKRLRAAGYKKLESKLDTIHGIDGVYVLRNHNGSPKEILIVENKVDSGQLNLGPPKQMSDDWIKKRIDKMMKSDDKNVRHTGKLLSENPNLLRKELWHHDLSNGVTSIHSLDREANKTSQRTVRYLGNATQKRCESANPSINCFPTVQ